MEAKTLREIEHTIKHCAKNEFDDPRVLRALFHIYSRLYAWRFDLPETDTLNNRIILTIDSLLEKFDFQGRNALVLLLMVLSERKHPIDLCHTQLAHLALKLSKELGAGREHTHSLWLSEGALGIDFIGHTAEINAKMLQVKALSQPIFGWSQGQNLYTERELLKANVYFAFDMEPFNIRTALSN